ncbi:MAG: hypothetical protein JWO96_719 [Candidatus Saccharibacteria bacterium]|nr:hypothetical protein [Candidatus Saccharibacteria bacterium]
MSYKSPRDPEWSQRVQAGRAYAAAREAREAEAARMLEHIPEQPEQLESVADRSHPRGKKGIGRIALRPATS